MPRLEVYVPDDLASRLKARRAEVNVSSLLQEALAAKLEELARQDALNAVLAEYQDDLGAFTAAELADARRSLEPAHAIPVDAVASR